jgi:parvulin-like peptidyl-prolyl isomerase
MCNLLKQHVLISISSETIRYTIFVLQIAQEYSECPSGKKGGDLGWFPRGKMAGPFQEVAFSTPMGATSAPFKSTYVFFLDY